MRPVYVKPHTSIRRLVDKRRLRYKQPAQRLGWRVWRTQKQNAKYKKEQIKFFHLRTSIKEYQSRPRLVAAVECTLALASTPAAAIGNEAEHLVPELACREGTAGYTPELLGIQY